MEEEIWVKCNLECNYMVSNFGNVRHINKKENLKYSLSKNKKGYPQVRIYVNSVKTCQKIHKLVMISFKQNEYFEGAVINHIDGNKLNNRLDNLEWCTPSENQKHAYKNNLLNIKPGRDHNVSKLKSEQVKEIKNLLKTKKLTMKEISKKYSISYENVRSIKNNKIWKHILI